MSATSKAQDVALPELLGFLPAHAALVAVWCDDAEVAAIAATHSAAREAMVADAVWQEMLVAHYPKILRHAAEHLAAAPEEAATPSTTGAAHFALCRTLPAGRSKRLYRSLRHAVAAAVPSLNQRARLALMVHELQEWERVRREFTLQRQAELVVRAMGKDEAAARIHGLAHPNKLKLVSLQAMASGTTANSALEASDVAAADLQRLIQERLVRRREEWHRQRMDLLQDLSWDRD